MTGNDATRALSRDAFLYPRWPRAAPGDSHWMPCTRCTGRSRATRAACPSSSCTAGPAAAARPTTAASTIRPFTGSSSTTSAAPASRRRWASSRDNTTPHLVARHRAAARASRHRALAGVRRLVGLDPGARLRRSAPGARARPGAARHFPVPAAGDSLVSLPDALRAAGGVAQLRRLPAGRRARRPARGLPSPPDRSRSGRAHARRASLEPLRRLVLDLACRTPTWFRISTKMRWRWRSRASRPTTSSTGSSCRTTRCSPASVASGTCPAPIVQGRYDLVCPIFSADDLHRAWPEAEYIVVRMPATRRASPASRASWSRQPIAFAAAWTARGRASAPALALIEAAGSCAARRHGRRRYGFSASPSGGTRNAVTWNDRSMSSPTMPSA